MKEKIDGRGTDRNIGVDTGVDIDAETMKNIRINENIESTKKDKRIDENIESTDICENREPIFLGEEDYLDQMIHVVRPLLEKHRKTGYFISFDGTKIFL